MIPIKDFYCEDGKITNHDIKEAVWLSNYDDCMVRITCPLLDDYSMSEYVLKVMPGETYESVLAKIHNTNTKYQLKV